MGQSDPADVTQTASVGADNKTTATRALDGAPTGTLDAGARFGRYTILELAGQGGMGAVYSAYDAVLDRRVALKLLASAVGEEPRRRLLREAQAIARLSHPNIVTVYDAGMIGTEVFIAMEYLTGANLRSWSRDPEAGRGWRDVVERFIEAGRGLDAAHAAGIIHRDFKPSNVLIDEHGRARVLDFGIATADPEPTEAPPGGAMLQSNDGYLTESTDGWSEQTPTGSDVDSLTRTGAVIGTPVYMTLDRLRGHTASRRDDVYAFFVSLYECLAGQKPYRASTLKKLRGKLRAGRPPEIADTSIPRWLRSLVREGLASNGDGGFDSMAPVLAELTRRSNPWRRRRSIAAAAALGMLALGAGGAFVLGEPNAAGPAPCSDAEARVATVWSPERGTRVAAQFAGTGLSYAAETAARVADTLDAYRDQWAQSHTAVCLASQRGLQSPTLLDLRMHCLDRARSRLDATARVLEEASAETVARSPRLAAALPRVADCESLTERGRPLPQSPVVRERIRAVESRINRADALRLAARYGEAVREAELAAREAEGLDYPAVLAQSLDALGRTQDRLAEHTRANETLSRGYFTAIEAGEDELAAEIAAKLIGNQAGALGDFDAALVWARHGLSVARRSESPVARAVVTYALGTVHLRRGDLDTAAAELGRARELLEQSVGDAHSITSRVYNNLGVIETFRGRHDESAAYYQRAYDIWERRGGANHPETISILNNLALPLANQGRFAEAKVLYERSIDQLGRALGTEHPDLIDPLTNLGLVHARLGDHELAAGPIRRAIAIRTAVSGADHLEIAQLRSYLAEVLHDAGSLIAAQKEVEAAIAQLTEIEGPSSALLVEPLHRAALVARGLEQTARARALAGRALGLAERADAADPDVVRALRALHAGLGPGSAPASP